jgi:nucleoside-diphosphate-sugar epimerase
VRDVGRAVRLALQKDVSGQVFNICEDRTYSMRLWSEAILDAAGSSAELVRVRDEALPEDLRFTGTVTQHILASGKKAKAMLGWQTSDPIESLRTTVSWHLDHPPADADANFDADDRALASV